ncbi:MAG: tRNA (N6-threonylcarbamoyladenosine(37)-N6)-methyltransferase TrmO [Halodesulfurarchaeum sp.]
MTDDVCYSPIGTIHSPFTGEEGMPIQSGFSNTTGTVSIDDAYVEGLRDLEGFSHVVLVYHFHEADGYDLETTPYMEDEPHGVFATRAPRRPNPIGLSVVSLETVVGGTLTVGGIDVLDGTPLLDLKPFVPTFNGVAEGEIGWLTDVIGNEDRRRADDRFLS